jgi:radical SAM protein with 4Fe4S-binding SPASM domain
MKSRKDLFNQLKHTNLRKLWNGFLVIASYYLSKYAKRPVQWGNPISISFEPTTACNLRCPECPSGLRSFTRPVGNLKSNFFQATIDQLAPTLSSMMFYFQGEPFIHPEFLDMVAYAESKGIYTITSTNGHFLSGSNIQKILESKLSRLVISIDGTTQETYEQYRKEGNLNVVLEGTKKLVQARKAAKSSHPHIIFQYLVVKPNEHQIPDARYLAKDIGVDEIRFKSAQLYDFVQGNALMPSNEKYSRYVQNKSGQFEIKNQLADHCWKLWHACVITWDGVVVPCCFDKDAQHRLGDLKKSSFEQIWKSPDYTSFRQKILIGRKEIDICQNCTEGTKVFVGSIP